MESFPVKLAREAVEAYVREGRIISMPEDIPDYLKKRAGAFVSIKKEGELRGCIGTIEPCEENVASEIIRNAISAATCDPRFFPVTSDELDELVYSVDVLEEPEPVKDMSELDPAVYGVIVECGARRGVLLPDLEGVDTPEEQIRICRLKAGIMPDEPLKIYRFKVTRYT